MILNTSPDRFLVAIAVMVGQLGQSARSLLSLGLGVPLSEELNPSPELRER